MPQFLTPSRGQATYGIGVCARCQQKFWLDQLFDDPNYPGLKVCTDDMDQLDPYRLPPREADQITLAFTRPEEPITPAISTKPGDAGWPPADAVTTQSTDTVIGT